MPSNLARCCLDSACGGSLGEASASLYQSVTRTSDNDALDNWIQLVIDADAVKKDANNAMSGV